MMDVARPDWPHGYSDRRGIGPGRKGQCQKLPAGNFFKVGAEPFDAAAYGLPRGRLAPSRKTRQRNSLTGRFTLTVRPRLPVDRAQEAVQSVRARRSHRRHSECHNLKRIGKVPRGELLGSVHPPSHFAAPNSEAAGTSSAPRCPPSPDPRLSLRPTAYSGSIQRFAATRNPESSPRGTLVPSTVGDRFPSLNQLEQRRRSRCSRLPSISLPPDRDCTQAPCLVPALSISSPRGTFQNLTKPKPSKG